MLAGQCRPACKEARLQDRGDIIEITRADFLLMRHEGIASLAAREFRSLHPLGVMFHALAARIMVGVIGIKDEIRGEVIKAVVVPSAKPDESLAEALRHHVKTRLAAHQSTRIIVFAECLPTTTDKIKRAELRRQNMAENNSPED